jgi:hypothetical protein
MKAEKFIATFIEGIILYLVFHLGYFAFLAIFD